MDRACLCGEGTHGSFEVGRWEERVGRWWWLRWWCGVVWCGGLVNGKEKLGGRGFDDERALLRGLRETLSQGYRGKRR